VGDPRTEVVVVVVVVVAFLVVGRLGSSCAAVAAHHSTRSRSARKARSTEQKAARAINDPRYAAQAQRVILGTTSSAKPAKSRAKKSSVQDEGPFAKAWKMTYCVNFERCVGRISSRKRSHRSPHSPKVSV
jgi:hypothetical protein